jgi:hypoxia up-regulated 1
VDFVLKNAGLSVSDVSSLVLVGGGVRIPAIQTVLNDLVGSGKIARNVDGDEAAVFGAVFQAAAISAQFKTRRDLRIKDILEKSVSLSYKMDNQEMTSIDILPLKSVLGSKKLVTLNGLTDKNVTLNLFYGDSKQKEPLYQVLVTGLPSLSETYKDKKIKSIKVKALIELSLSGTVHIQNVYALVEVDSESKNKIADTLGNVINFFGGKKENEEEDGEKQDKTDETKEEEPLDANKNITESTNKSQNETTPSTKKPLMDKIPLNFTISWKSQVPLSEKEKKEIKQM